jgi:hypothetical protein
MGFLKNMKDAMGQAQDAAAQWQQNAGGAPAGMDVSGAMASRGSLQSQAHEQNRILTTSRSASPDASRIR